MLDSTIAAVLVPLLNNLENINATQKCGISQPPTIILLKLSCFRIFSKRLIVFSFLLFQIHIVIKKHVQNQIFHL